MTLKLKPGTRVLIDGDEHILLDRAPLAQWRYADTDELVNTATDGKPYRYGNGPYQVRAVDGGREVYQSVTHDGEGKGPAWWVQDAETGSILTHSIRESIMEPVAGPLLAAELIA